MTQRPHFSQPDETRPKLSASSGAAPPNDALVGASPIFRHVLDKIHRYARHDEIPVLLEGETGTGKSMVARYLHSISPRAGRPLLEIDLGVLDDGTATSELFGHTKGAFTGAVSDARGLFAEAHGGTVFLDELENATPAVQRRLLFISESGELRPLGATRNMHVDIRLVTATNVPLRELVAKKLFLPDLAARLSGCPIMLPPLHRRRQDIPLLVGYFIARFARATSYEKDPDFTVPLLHALQAAPWPDNVRGLAFTVRRLMVEAYPARVIGLEHCVDDLAFLRSVGTGTGRPTRAEAEALVHEHGSVAAAAHQLGISRATFYRCLSTRGEETPHRRVTDQ